ncbi:MAG: hypothetical protein OEO23_13410 [Gemmatimonadota bacterium]|nr:hypothetical protein [Gemmatimonadota bacterium]
MARHNRIGSGNDQAGFRYEISYPPDWLARVKVTRRLDSGRRSTKVLFVNPLRRPLDPPPASVRIAVRSPDQGMAVEASFGPGPDGAREWKVEWAPPGGDGRISLTFVPFAWGPVSGS